MRRARARVSAGGVFVGLLIVCVYGTFLAPLVVVIASSLDASDRASFSFPPRQLSLKAYSDIPPRYLGALGTSLLLATVSSVAACLVGIPAALGLVRGRARGKSLISAILRAPLQIPFVVTGVAFLQTYHLAGDLLGIDLVGTFGGLALAHVFLTTPYVIGTVSAALQRFNPRLEEAAVMLGATRWSTFRRVTLPLVMPGVYAGALYAFVTSFSDIPVTLFLASPRYMTLPVEIFYSLEFDFNPSMLAMSTLIVIFSLGVLWLTQRVAGLDVLLRTGGRG